jgi:hypothetical protein
MIDLKIYLSIVFIGLILTVSLFLVEGKIISTLKDDSKFKIWWRRYIIQDSDEDS